MIRSFAVAAMILAALASSQTVQGRGFGGGGGFRGGGGGFGGGYRGGEGFSGGGFRGGEMGGRSSATPVDFAVATSAGTAEGEFGGNRGSEFGGYRGGEAGGFRGADAGGFRGGEAGGFRGGEFRRQSRRSDALAIATEFVPGSAVRWWHALGFQQPLGGRFQRESGHSRRATWRRGRGRSSDGSSREHCRTPRRRSVPMAASPQGVAWPVPAVRPLARALWAGPGGRVAAGGAVRGPAGARRGPGSCGRARRSCRRFRLSLAVGPLWTSLCSPPGFGGYGLYNAGWYRAHPGRWAAAGITSAA